MIIICSECGKEYSDQANTCPHCGAITSQNRYISNNIQGTNSCNFNHSYQNNIIQENNMGLAITGFVIGIVSLFIFPILGLLSLVLGAIVIEKNENGESWNKAVWKYENKALGFGRCSLIFGIIDIIWMILNYYIFNYI